MSKVDWLSGVMAAVVMIVTGVSVGLGLVSSSSSQVLCWCRGVGVVAVVSILRTSNYHRRFSEH